MWMGVVVWNMQTPQALHGGCIILLFVHHIALDTVAEAVVAPLDNPMVDGAAIFAVDNDRHELHRHPVSCIYKCVVMIGYRNRYTAGPTAHPMYAYMIHGLCG